MGRENQQQEMHDTEMGIEVLEDAAAVHTGPLALLETPSALTRRLRCRRRGSKRRSAMSSAPVALPGPLISLTEDKDRWKCMWFGLYRCMSGGLGAAARTERIGRRRVFWGGRNPALAPCWGFVDGAVAVADEEACEWS
jgi:hypothetical protein